MHVYGPVIDRGPLKMHGAAVEPHAGSERALLRVEAAEGRQQRGMDVDEPIARELDEGLAENPHDAGEAHECIAGRLQRGVERGVEFVARRMVAVRNHLRRNARLRSAPEPLRIAAVRQHEPDLRREVALHAGVDQRLQVRAAARDQHGNLQPGHCDSVLSSRVRGASPARATMPPMRWTRSPAAWSVAVTRSTASGATTATMPMPQLKGRAISSRAMPAVYASPPKA